ncbi:MULTISPECIES: CoA transferase [unclassified Brevibacterium]|uniref:CaiB/BaiF CoA transferase family protein n=1 Tax=unclassified Brevibacterium TaxID=2614124 RepID=UPI001E2C1BC2|nr:MULTISPECIES: CoA transferase [unclassified Brevibacterium]MCD1286140.1 CoA transferase [Brevibacterium sp. CCUG 69071]MDK8433497.1 CoA transferase [Brevibacterium sp. H-BE7]
MKPLEDIRIIAVEQYGAGPWGSMHLADLGADVIKIEDPNTGGDIGRYVPPYREGEDSLFYESFNRNKRSIALSLKDDEDRAVFDRLVATADVVYSNLRGDVPAKLGITYDDLSSINPQIVCCTLSGYGSQGAAARRPGYDYMLQAAAGWMDITGEPDGPPTKSGLSLVDFSGGLVAAISMLAAVHAARRDGVGTDCDLSLFDTAVSMLSYVGNWHLNEGFEPRRTPKSSHPSLVPFQAFEAADGWLTVGCAKEKFYRRLVDVIGDERLNAEEFSDFERRIANKDRLLPLLDEAFLQRSAEEWVSLLESAGVPVAKVKSVAEALDDPLVEERGLVFDTDHGRWGTIRNIATAPRAGARLDSHRAAPQIDEHRAELLAELGLNTTSKGA